MEEPVQGFVAADRWRLVEDRCALADHHARRRRCSRGRAVRVPRLGLLGLGYQTRYGARRHRGSLASVCAEN